MKTALTLVSLAFLAACASAQTVRVGTFHKPSVVVAFYRSPQWAETMKSKLAERDQAKAAGDTKKVEELESWGQNHQEQAHQQLTGAAPIDNILQALAPAFPEIAARAGVALIVADMPYAGRAVQTVDITDQVLDWLKADERTRSIVRDLRSRPGNPPPVH